VLRKQSDSHFILGKTFRHCGLRPAISRHSVTGGSKRSRIRHCGPRSATGKQSDSHFILGKTFRHCGLQPAISRHSVTDGSKRSRIESGMTVWDYEENRDTPHIFVLPGLSSRENNRTVTLFLLYLFLKNVPSLRAPTRNLQAQCHRWFEEIPDRVRDDGMGLRMTARIYGLEE
jgi:hypothetical protein